MSKMGWTLSGQGFPRKWNRAWSRSVKKIVGILSSDFDVNPENELDIYRHIVQLTKDDLGGEVHPMVVSKASPEVLIPPTRTLEQLLESRLVKV